MAKSLKKKKRVNRVERTRNANTLTESQYWGKIRSALRNAFKFWKPMQMALEKASRPYNGTNKKQKKEYQCAACKKWFPRTGVEIDHIIGCGSLRSYEDIEPFIKRLTVEDVNAYQVLCVEHHREKTLKERQDARN